MKVGDLVSLRDHKDRCGIITHTITYSGGKDVRHRILWLDQQTFPRLATHLVERHLILLSEAK